GEGLRRRRFVERAPQRGRATGLLRDPRREARGRLLELVRVHDEVEGSRVERGGEARIDQPRADDQRLVECAQFLAPRGELLRRVLPRLRGGGVARFLEREGR